MSVDLSFREKLRGLYYVLSYRPELTVFIVIFGLLVTVLEGVGVSFIVPIIEAAESPGAPPTDQNQLVVIFATIYGGLGVPLTLGTLLVGVSFVLVARYGTSAVVDWLQVSLRSRFVRDLKSTAFRNALDARIKYFDREGSEAILNAILVQADEAGKVIRDLVLFFNVALLIVVYVAIAVYLAPMLTVISLVIVGTLSITLRGGLEPGYHIGDRVAEANERIQETVQAGTQGIREVKLLGLADTLFDTFNGHVNQHTQATIQLGRNEAVLKNSYNAVIAVLVFTLIYIAIVLTDMSFSSLAAFLFVMFRLGPSFSLANKRFYKVEGRLPHLLRTQTFIEALDENHDITGGNHSIPEQPTPIKFQNVSFTYENDQPVLNDVSFTVNRSETVAFVGTSGTGKSTIAALLARLYQPDTGSITAAGVPINEFNIDEWRSRIAFVRQNPYIFNATLLENLTLGNPSATREMIERVCDVAQLSSVIADLPEGYESPVGDNGVRLSGGQRQRVAIARALLQDADIYVFDEATSNLDSTTERHLLKAINAMGEDYTIIVITHHLSTVHDADRIYTITDGTITESGDHGELLQENQMHARLHAEQ